MTLFLACLLSFLLTASASGETFSGRVAQIQDGDTFDLCSDTLCTRIRLCGVDAPERGNAGASEATAALRTLLGDREIRCVQVGGGTVCDGRSRPTNGNRVVAQCFVGGQDIAGWLVEAGQACDWVRFSGGHYSRGGAGKVCPPR